MVDASTNVTVPTIAELLARWEREKPAALALLLPQNEGVRVITWRELAADVRRVAGAWQRWGLEPSDRVAQISSNRYEWILNDLALLMLGGVHVVISEKTALAVAAEQLIRTAPRAVICRDAETWHQIQSLCPALAEVPCLVYEGSDDPQAHVQSWQAWLQQNGHDPSDLNLPMVAGKDPATIVFSSGTTGEPRGIVLTQQNLLSNAVAIATAFADEPTGRRLCWLPLSHLYARTADLYCWLVRGSELALVERPEDVLAAAQKTQPEFMNVVPYFLDKLLKHVQGSAATQADRAAMLQELLGGKIRLLISGGAALSDSTRQFYAEHGIAALQGYGLTEAGPVAATETLAYHRRGSVGRPLPGVEVRFTDEGELCVRSPGVMSGYWQDPRMSESKLHDGWLHTGDLGRIDDDGFLFVDGRCDEVLVLSTGCKVSPTTIEAALLDEPLIQQILVVGHGRKHLAALIVPNPDNLRAEIISRAIAVTSREQALVHPKVLNLYRTQIAERLQQHASREQLREIVLIGRGWTPESGEMTASLKLRRALIQQNFAAEIERLYAGT
jgi:long-chain acyl-CoA synthetase